MTDHTKLLSDFPQINPSNYGDDEVNAMNAWGIAAQTAIEELQGENERLKRELEISKLDAKEWYSQADALQAKLDAMGKGEPVAFMDQWGEVFRNEADAADHMEGEPTKLYAEPKALAPLTDERIDELADTAFTDYMEDRNDDHDRAFARAIEAAHGIGGTP